MNNTVIPVGGVFTHKRKKYKCVLSKGSKEGWCSGCAFHGVSAVDCLTQLPACAPGGRADRHFVHFKLVTEKKGKLNG